MAPIPSKSKVSIFNTDSFSFETMIVVLCVIMFGSHLVEKYVHARFEIPAILCIVVIVIYLLYPSELNYGKNGAQRLMICAKYYFKQVRRHI